MPHLRFTDLVDVKKDGTFLPFEKQCVSIRKGAVSLSVVGFSGSIHPIASKASTRGNISALYGLGLAIFLRSMKRNTNHSTL